VDETTARILDAACEVIARDGLKRSSMEDIARRAGVTRVTVYRHVASKDALVEAVVRRDLERHVTTFLAGQRAATTAADRVIGGYVSTIQALRRSPVLQGILAVELDALVASMAGSAQRVLYLARQFLAAQLGAEQTAGGIGDEIDVDVVADLMVRLAVSFVLVPSDVVDLDDDDAAAEMARSFLVPLLGWSLGRSAGRPMSEDPRPVRGRGPRPPR
jgi:TetR/AcrR family transcriptional repressor of uid operon